MYLFIYFVAWVLVAAGELLSCSRGLLSCSAWVPQLQQASSLVAACQLLSCGMWALRCCSWAPQLQNVGSLVVAGKLLVVACMFSHASNPGPLHWERGVLSTMPPGKSQDSGKIIVLYSCLINEIEEKNYKEKYICMDFYIYLFSYF